MADAVKLRMQAVVARHGNYLGHLMQRPPRVGNMQPVKVNDRHESWFDVENLVTRRFHQDIDNPGYDRTKASVRWFFTIPGQPKPLVQARVA